LLQETYIDGAIIWLDFGYLEIIKQEKINENDLAQFFDDYDNEISADISQCGGEVMRSNESAFVIVLARSARENESEIVGRAFKLVRAMLDLLERKFRSMDIDSTSHRLILGYGTMHRVVRSFGRAVTGDLFRECRRKAATLGPGRAMVFSRIYDILAQAGSPWLDLLSPIDDDGFDIDWSKSHNHKF
jgi:hypothetical protein